MIASLPPEFGGREGARHRCLEHPIRPQDPYAQAKWFASPDTIGGHSLREVVRLSDPEGEITKPW
jgi:hypothetical protein